MKLLLVLSALLACAFAQLPKPCSAPAMFESRIFRIDPSKKFDVKAKFSYDGLNERIRHIDEIDAAGDFHEYFDVIDVFREKKRYIYNLVHKNCSVEDMKPDETFRRIAIPPGARAMGESVIGTTSVPGAGVTISLWSDEFEDKSRYFGAWTLVGCLPVTDYFYSDRSGLVHTSFFDVTTGISDPNVFIPPSACMQ